MIRDHFPKWQKKMRKTYGYLKKNNLFLWVQLVDVYVIYPFATFDIYCNICQWEF